MSSPTYRIDNLLESSQTPLGKLIAQAQALEALNQLFLKILDPQLAAHCRVGDYRLGVLTLFTINAASATQLRYRVSDLLSQLRAYPTWAGLCSIKVKVQTHGYQKPSFVCQSEPKPALLKPSTAEQLLALAAHLKAQPDNDQLVKSLERLASHQKGP